MTPVGRKRILLAELEDRLALSLLARLYEHNRTYDVLLSRTADVTQTLLQAERFSVVVIHAHPSKPGDIALLETELARAGDTSIVALIDSAPDANAASLYAAGADSVHPITTAAAELADEVIRVSRADTLLEGRLDEVGTPELIQMLCLCRRSLMLRIETGSERAAVWLSNGEIHHAVSDALSGQSAMSRIVRADSGRFRAIATSVLPARSIHQDWQHVMLEAAREGDEAAQQSSRQKQAAGDSVPPPAQSVVRKLGKTYRELTELGLQSIKAGDFSKAREYWAAARSIGPDGPSAHAPTLLKGSSTQPPSAPSLIKATTIPPPKRAERR